MVLGLPDCPSCGSSRVVKNGSTHSGKQNHRCKDCGRQFVEDPENKVVSAVAKQLVDKLLLENIPLAGVARVAEVSEPWLRQYIKGKNDGLSPLKEKLGRSSD